MSNQKRFTFVVGCRRRSLGGLYAYGFIVSVCVSKLVRLPVATNLPAPLEQCCLKDRLSLSGFILVHRGAILLHSTSIRGGAACYPVLNQSRCVPPMGIKWGRKSIYKVFKDHSVKLKANFSEGVKQNSYKIPLSFVLLERVFSAECLSCERWSSYGYWESQTLLVCQR